MKDKIGTLLGFTIGLFLILFGITWPDHLSNYHMYQTFQLENTIRALQDADRPVKEIRAAQQALENFESSWVSAIARFLDLKSLLIVFGGTYAATLIAFPLSRAFYTFLYIAQAFSRDKLQQEYLEVYEASLAIGKKRVNNEVILEEDIAHIQNTHFQQWLRDFIMVDLVSEEMIEEIISSEVEMYNRRAFEEIDVLEFMGRAAPAFGMIGTVVGLILMLGNANSGDILQIIGGMAVAMITTLYGVMVANLVFIPVATKRYQLKESNITLLEMTKEAILYLKKRELPDVMSQDLIIYLPTRLRKRITNEKQASLKNLEFSL